jgi:hypothetical protein
MVKGGGESLFRAEVIYKMVSVMRGMQNNETAKVLMDDFRNHYNVLRPHMGIGNCTPAEIARLNFELGRNKIQNLIK